MKIVASNSLTVSKVDDGTITHTAWSYSADGTDSFTTVYPNLNLLDGTKDFSGTWTNSSSWVTDGTYKGLTVKKRTGQWYGIYKEFTAPKDGKYTFSTYVKSSGNTANILMYLGINSTSPTATKRQMGNNFDWIRDSVTLNLKANDTVWVRYEISGSGTDSILWTAGHKWEQGSVATPYMQSASEVKPTDYPSYRGEYSDFLSTASTDPSKYSWGLIRENSPYTYTAYANSADGTDDFTTVYPGKNFIRNSDFRNGLDNWTGDTSKFIISQESGDNLVTVTVTGQNNIGVKASLFGTTIPVKTNDYIIVSGWFRGKDIETKSFFIVEGYDSNGISVQYNDIATNSAGIIWSMPVTNNTWSKFYLRWKITNANAVSAGFRFVPFHNGTYSYKKFKLEADTPDGKATPWTPTPSEDPLGVIPKYVGTAALPYDSYSKYEWKINVDWINQFNINQQSEIINAQNAADKANNSISDMSKDSILTPIEKRKLLVDWTSIQSEYSKLVANANKFGVSTTAYASAYSVLSGYILSLISNLTVNSTIVANTFKTNFKNYYDAKVDLMNNTNLAIQANMDALGTNTAYAYSADGTDRFTVSYPNLNLLKGTKTPKSITGNNTVNQTGLLYSFDNNNTLANQGFSVNDTVTFEFDWSATNPASGQFTLQWNGKPWLFNVPTIKPSSTNGSGHVTHTFNITDLQIASTAVATGLGYRFDNIPTNTVITFYNVIISKAKTSQPWMPSEKELTSDDIPKYVGYSVRQSENPEDFSWQPYGGLNSYNITKATTAIEQNSKEIALKANKLEVDTLSGRVLATESSLQIQDGKITALNTKTDGHTTQIGTLESSYSGLTSTISEIQTEVGGKAGKTELSQLSQDLSGFKTTVANTYADKVSVASQITQSATAVTSNVQSWTNNKLTAYSTTQQTATSITNAVADKADKTQITQLSDSINLKVSKGDVVSQINVEAGRTLIDTKQLLLNADTVKFSGSAFIPNSVIQNLSADKITAGTLNAANVNVINLNADSLTAGTITGIDVRSSTFYGSSTLGDMQLNSNNLIFSKSDNIFTIDYSGITNVNTNYGTRNINFYSEGIEIKSGNNNTGVFKNSGLILDGAESYIDFRSDTGAARIWKTNTNKLLMITNSGGDIKIQAGNIDFSGSNLLNTANIVTTQDNINKVKSLLIGDAPTNVVGSTGRYLILDTNNGTFGMGGMWQSDRKLKKNIKKAKGSALDILDKIGVKQFDWKEGGSHVEYGLIAQEVESALPQAVFEVEQDDGSFIKQIEATGIIPILIKSIHELKSEIENIKNNINFKEK